MCLNELIASPEWALNFANRAILATSPARGAKLEPHERGPFHPVVREMSESFYRAFNLHALDTRRVENFAATDLWPVKHRHIDGYAVRLIVWFDTSNSDAVIIAFGGNKHPNHDLWYDRAVKESELAIDQLLRQRAARRNQP